jgi:hypothetical protein
MVDLHKLSVKVRKWCITILNLVYPVFVGVLLGIVLVPLFLIIFIGLKLLFMLVL